MKRTVLSSTVVGGFGHVKVTWLLRLTCNHSVRRLCRNPPKITTCEHCTGSFQRGN